MDLPGALRSRPCYHTAMAPPTIVVLGALNMDLVAFTSRLPGPGETVVGTRFLSYPGGKGANQAVAAARMGARVRMVGRVGDDYFGRRLLEPPAGGRRGRFRRGRRGGGLFRHIVDHY